MGKFVRCGRMPRKPTSMSTDELRALLARGDATIERFVSSKNGRAKVVLAGADGKRRSVIVTDRA